MTNSDARKPKPLSQRIARVAGITLKISGIVFCLAFGLVIVVVAIQSRTWWLLGPSLIAMAAALCIGLIAGLVRVAVSVFFFSKMRLGEMLLTLLAGGAANAGLSNWILNATQEMTTTECLTSRITGFLSIFLAFGVGSAWAWSAARRLDEQRTWQRIKLMVLGWLFAAGVVAVALFVLFTPFFILGGLASGLERYYAELFPGSLLIIPAFRIERRCRALERKKSLSVSSPPAGQ